MSLTLLISVVMCLIGWIFLEPIFLTLGATPELIPLIRSYMSIWFFSAPCLMVPMVSLAALRAMGMSHIQGYLMSGAAVLNATMASIARELRFQYLLGYVPSQSAGAAYEREGTDAMGEREGTITLRTGMMRASRDWLADPRVALSRDPGDYVYVEVRDEGCGMDAATRARIFEPFFTTKFAGRGLGLAAVLGIVRGHRGALRIDTEPGRGTAFHVLFPASAAVADAPGGPTPARLRARRQARVLVVDDEPSVLAIARETLTRAGFTVVTASNGSQALDQVRAGDPPIDAVLLDMTMPGMSGVETLRGIHATDAIEWVESLTLNVALPAWLMNEARSRGKPMAPDAPATIEAESPARVVGAGVRYIGSSYGDVANYYHPQQTWWKNAVIYGVDIERFCDGDGIADRAYRPNDIVDDILWRYPQAKLLLNSPAVEVLRFAQSRLPALYPGGVIDTAPLLHVPPARAAGSSAAAGTGSARTSG